MALGIWILKILTILLIGTKQTNSGKQKRSLYNSGQDSVLVLNSQNFDSLIFNQEKAYFIEFYASWCGECIDYAPVFKEFALSVRGWSPIVQIGVVDCKDDSALCRVHDVEGVPAIKYFKYKSQDESDGTKYHGDKRNIRKLIMNLAHLVRNDWSSRKVKPSQWPTFTFLRTKLPPPLWMNNAQFVAIVTDKNITDNKHNLVTPFGAQSLIDWNGVPELVLRVVTVDHPLSVLSLDKDSPVPGVVVYKKGVDNPVYSSREKLTRETLNKILSKYVKLSPVAVPSSKTVNPPASKSVSSYPENPHEVYIEDLESGLSYMLRHEISLKKEFSSKQMNALINFMDLLRTYFPGKPQIRQLLIRVSSWLRERGEGGSLSGDEWVKYIQKVNSELGDPLPSTMTWVACQGSSPEFRGYPCSLWTIFHLLTVQAYNRDGTSPSFKALDILEDIHGYVKYFFACTECSNNFERSAVKLPEQVSKPEDSVLWLWESHNRANHFIKGLPSVDPHFPKEQFPTSQMCPTCRTHDPGPQGGYFNTKWDTKEVLTFLTEYYSKENIKTLEKEQPIMFGDDESRGGKYSGDDRTVSGARGLTFNYVSRIGYYLAILIIMVITSSITF
jgi:thiol oxidase